MYSPCILKFFSLADGNRLCLWPWREHQSLLLLILVGTLTSSSSHTPTCWSVLSWTHECDPLQISWVHSLCNSFLPVTLSWKLLLSTINLPFFPISVLYLWESRHYAQTTPKKWEVTFYLLKGRIYKLLGILLHGRFIFSFPFIYISIGAWVLIYTLAYNPILLCFVAQTVPALTIGRSFSSCDNYNF